METVTRINLGVLLFHTSLLLTSSASPSHGDEVPKSDPKEITVKIWNGTQPCFTFRDQNTSVDRTKITIKFKYDKFDSGNGEGDLTGTKCSCDRAPFSSQAGFRVFSHLNRNFSSVRDTQSIIEGDLENIPDLEEFNSSKKPRNKNYDVLPKSEKIEFPIQYINGTQALFYLVEVWCG